MEHGVVFGYSKEALLAFITAACMMVSIILLARDIKRSQAHPHLWAWVIRCGLCVAALVSQIACGATHSLALSIGQVVCTLVIITLIIRAKSGGGALSGTDCTGIMMALSGITLWAICGDPIYGIIGTILADIAATAVGIRAAFVKGSVESLPFWACSLFAATAALQAAGSSHIAILLTPLFSIVNALVNISIVIIVKRNSVTRQPAPEPSEA